ncbi:calcium-translocating P-type ATPase PMCA-type [Penicillium maclennaniae]|uniref:calcium-translocating P-type ATPase PMCA-type n=1 Tax=Penicillium maclennaniae TaxID=1343394 RepID=UPI0025417858|nr:calcium-translocating P-type ATPase PMCA-type [Penicillium maclennaniae]KAJ5666380.1 calcium-translocating P-type ATPase PMCA-type [Penicillium maclennaniae]
MGFKTFITLATLGLAAAESSVVSLFIFGADSQSLFGSVVASNAKTTTYSINCAPGADTEDCGYLPGLLYTAAPTSVAEGTIICSMGGTTSARCTDLFPTSGHFSQPAAYTTLGQEDISAGMIPVTITAGPSTTATRASAATQTGSSADAASTGSSSTSTGGLPRMTANPSIVMSGAAAALMAVVL